MHASGVIRASQSIYISRNPSLSVAEDFERNVEPKITTMRKAINRYNESGAIIGWRVEPKHGR